MQLPERATQPTMYFIGVTTTQSSIMTLFPRWAQAMGLTNAVLKGIDIGIHAPAEDYRRCVEFIRDDPLSLGALVTTHKIDLLNATRDLFDKLDPYAVAFNEISSIAKQDGKLVGAAKDPISSGLAMEAFLPADYFATHGGEVLILGAGGSALAISAYLARRSRGANVPSRIVLTNRSQPRLDSARQILGALDLACPFDYHLVPEPAQNDRILAGLKPHSLVVNATGLGKDRPGSPLTDEGVFPQGGIAWELNYRGALDFLHQAERQRESRALQVEDGWIYFIHGWTQVIAEVFHIDIAPHFDTLERLAMELRNGK